MMIHTGYFNELLDNLHPSHGIVLAAHLGHHPEHFSVDEGAELFEHGCAVPRPEFKQFIYVFCRFNLPKYTKVLQTQTTQAFINNYIRNNCIII